MLSTMIRNKALGEISEILKIAKIRNNVIRGKINVKNPVLDYKI